MLGSIALTPFHWPAVLLGVAATLAVFAIGAGVGWYLGRRPVHRAAVSDDERDTVLGLLADLDGWTKQYSGDVSQHQDLLDSLSQAVRSDEERSLSSEGVVALLHQVIRSNDELKQKLLMAEGQLEQKSQQIKWYLTEARTDALTGLANRRALDQRLEELFAQHRRGGGSFAVALIDIDHFKAVNDAHGHAEGDRVLTAFAASLRRELSDALLVARFGGEEFAVILAGPLRPAAQRIERLRRKVARIPQHAGQTVLRLTISAGLSEPADDMGAASVVRRADEALYAAKNIGRNQVYFHDGREPVLVDAPEVVS
jgi:diguanylate cyclase